MSRVISPNPRRENPPRKRGAAKRPPGGEGESKIEVVQPAGNAVFGIDVAFKNELPASAPEERSEIDVAGLFICVSRIECEERNCGVSAESGPAFKNVFALIKRCAVNLVFLSPSALKRSQARCFSSRKIPDGGKKIFHTDILFAFIDEFGVTLKQIKFRKQFIVELDDQPASGFAESDGQMIFVFKAVRLILQLQRPVGRRELQARFIMVLRGICRKFQPTGFCAPVVMTDAEPGDFGFIGQVCETVDPSAPVQVYGNSVFPDCERI